MWTILAVVTAVVLTALVLTVAQLMIDHDDNRETRKGR